MLRIKVVGIDSDGIVYQMDDDGDWRRDTELWARYKHDPTEPHGDTLPMPIHREDMHHCDESFSADDQLLGQRLAFYMGTMLNDIGPHTKENVWDWFYRRRTSREEWTRVARALRWHGLRIVSSEPLPSVNAVDPHLQSEGTPTTRDPKSLSSNELGARPSPGAEK